VPRALRQIPNLITLIRILLIVPMVIGLLHRKLETVLILFAIAATSDALDGFLARRFGWQSVLGSILDPIADKLLLATLFVTLAVLKLMPVWLMATALARDVIIVSGAAAYRLFIGPLTAQPSVVSKFNTLCQAAFVLCVVARAEFFWPPSGLEAGLGALAFATTVVSGIDYVMTYGRRAAAAGGGGAAHGVQT
jgi:cardiolipin synthase (CMP-forming)